MKTLKLLLTIAVVLFVTSTAQAQEIFEAINNNNIAKVKTILEKDSSPVNLKDNAGNTPLHVAARNGFINIMEYLLSKGADINSVSAQGNTPLHEAVLNKKEAAVKLLLEKGADPNKQNVRGIAPLHFAARLNLISVIELLISKKADIEARDLGSKVTPLLLAVAGSADNVETVKLLVEKGADINAKNSMNGTALNNAVESYDKPKLVNFLLEMKVDYDTTGRAKINILNAAIRLGNVQLFNSVVNKCGNILFSSETDKKLYMKNALIGGSIEIIKILQGYNIPVDISANYRGWSPLHNAAAANKPETIEFLVKYGMDINSRTIDGRSPYNIADENGHKELMKQIIKLGGSDEPQKFPVLKGLYLGQTTPVNEMKRFAPGIIDNIFSSLSFSAGGKEIFWAANDNLITMRQESGKWSKPEILSFSGIGKSDFYDRSYDANPFISPDNKKLFFTSLRPPVKGKEAEAWKENIWVVERTANGFTDPVLLCKEINEIDLTAGISVSNSGTIYFNGREHRGIGDWEIFYSSLADGKYTKPVKLSPIINSKDNESGPFISPDESYIIFNRLDRTIGKPSSLISFKSNNGEWTEPVNLDKYLGDHMYPIVTPDGKYIFTKGGYWTEAKFIEELRPKN